MRLSSRSLRATRVKRALEGLMQRYGPKVYLDVDDIYVIDKYNRVVAVTYLRYNNTYMLNANKWLADDGYTQIVDYPNKFNLHTWSLYESVDFYNRKPRHLWQG